MKCPQVHTVAILTTDCAGGHHNKCYRQTYSSCTAFKCSCRCHDSTQFELQLNSGGSSYGPAGIEDSGMAEPAGYSRITSRRHIEEMAAAFNEQVEAVRRAYQIATHPFHLVPRLCVD